MKNLILSITLFALIVSISHAKEATYEQRIAMGVLNLEANNYSDAVSEFRAALKEKPDDLTATLYLGIALSRSGESEAETILKKALSMNPREPRTNLELGIYYYNKALYDEARDYLENTIRFAPKTEFSARAEEYLRAMKGAVRPWALNFSIGTQYDSNVVLNSTSNPLPPGITRKSDWRAVLYLKGRYNIIEKEGMEGSIGYSLYQSLHSRLSDFNVTQHLLELRGTYNVSPSLKLGGVYSFEYVYLGGDEYDYAHSISPSLTISEGKGFSTAVEYKYRNIHFKDSDLFANNSERTGSNNLIGITQNIPLTGSVSARLGYSHDVDSTRKDYWDYSGDKGFMSVRFNMQYRILIDLYGEYYRRDYDGVSPYSDSKRKDIIHTYAVSVTKGLSDRCSITIGQSYTRNTSNITAYDYKRAITSIFLNARF
ncbi:MAG: hypothetical protein OHK0032_07820 [Thermodesulfovibrionales bacterium]